MDKKYLWFDPYRYDTVINATTSASPGTNDLSDEMKTFYSDTLIDIASPLLVHDQFGQKHPIPRNGGKIIEFRKFSPLPKQTTALTEGVTPDGQALNVSTVTATVAQYGGWVMLTDMLQMTALDPMVVQATQLCGDQAGRTLDTISREVLNAGTNVQYGDGTSKKSRDTLTREDKLTVNAVFRAARTLKKNLAKPIDGSYVAIIHPDVAYDIMASDQWQDINKYSNAVNIFDGEIGKIGGVRFVETTEAKIFPKAGATDSALDSQKCDVYSTLFLGRDAYGVTEISGGGLETIVKQLGSAGTSDPLNQRSSVGWKATKVTVILVQEYMLRVETGSTFSDGVAN